jgi:hypothetical protein
MLLQVLVHFQTYFLQEYAWCEVRRQVTSVPSDARLHPLKHVNKPITCLGSVVIVLSMSVVGPLQVSAPVGGGAAHATGNISVFGSTGRLGLLLFTLLSKGLRT